MIEEFRVGDLPVSLKNEVLNRLAHFSVGFFTVEPSDHGLIFLPRGSGTFVSVIGSQGVKIYAILTAGHVVENLPRNGRLGLALGKGTLPHAELEADRLRYHQFPRGEVASLGPDLGVVVLPPHIADSICARKSFIDLDRTWEKLALSEPAINEGIWVTQGFLEERSSSQIESDDLLHINMYNFTGIGGIENQSVRGEFDYFDAPVVHEEDVPSRFNGMSGGGLWQVPLAKIDGEIAPQEPIYSGVLFFQESRETNESVIRCHGRRSCYGVARSWLKLL